MLAGGTYRISSNKSLLWINADLDYKPGRLNIVENKRLPHLEAQALTWNHSW